MRRSRKALVEDHLPAMRITLPPAGETLDPATLFPGAPDAVWVEIGFGGGEHLIHQAAQNPAVGLIGFEPYINGVATAVQGAVENDLTNVRIFDDDVRLLLPALQPASVDRVFILFPDPWPKRRHWNRRIVNSDMLDTVAAILRDGGTLRFASDHMGYARWALWHIRNHPAFAWTARCAADWRDRPADAIQTRYEAKARRQGDIPVFFDFTRQHRSDR